jgi:S-adenosylmethionine hydrolase
MATPPIVLLTDFGVGDAYVGMMHGVILGANPTARIIDLTHGIGAQDVRHGTVVLADSAPYFPGGSVFVAVVDPGVGTDRAALLLETPDARFLAPDNGLLTLLCRRYDSGFGDADTPGRVPVPGGCRAWRLNNPKFWRNPVSSTFHGRDVFAPVAGHLSLGVTPDEMGDELGNIHALALPAPRVRDGRLSGRVVYADAFGNLITDLTADLLVEAAGMAGDSTITVKIAGRTIVGLSRTFHDPAGGGLRALVGSHGRLEVIVVDGSAAANLEVGPGALVEVSPGGNPGPLP